MAVPPDDPEQNRLSGRLTRYARVSAGVGGAAARIAGAKLFGRDVSDPRNAADLAATLGGLKGPLMKVAQMMATIPDLLPPDYAAELQKLQAEAPPMGPAFVKRRMMVELGPDWESRFRSFERMPAAAASLGQVHKAVAHDGTPIACKLQYPDMKSAVEADLGQLGVILSLQRRLSPEIDTTEIAKELGERLREELDYDREAKHAALFRMMLTGERNVRVPETYPELSTDRLLTMRWLDGTKLLAYVGHDLADRNAIAKALFTAWWKPFATHGVIHGDPHLGNYTVFEKQEARSAGGATGKQESHPAGINLLDFGCVRIFPPAFVDGVINLYRALKADDRDGIAAAYRSWGFRGIDEETVDTLTLWARFIYGPLMDDRVRTIAGNVAPQAYGRREAWTVKQRLKNKPAIKVPREFVFLERAAIGLGAVMLHLKAELNFHQLFEAAIADFDVNALAKRQAKALKAVGL
jgi:predicted unusual protein kinase regulating ubiquinone biosynthesis (AarF/ABC1/UbiB family)